MEKSHNSNNNKPWPCFCACPVTYLHHSPTLVRHSLPSRLSSPTAPMTSLGKSFLASLGFIQKRISRVSSGLYVCGWASSTPLCKPLSRVLVKSQSRGRTGYCSRAHEYRAGSHSWCVSWDTEVKTETTAAPAGKTILLRAQREALSLEEHGGSWELFWKSMSVILWPIILTWASTSVYRLFQKITRMQAPWEQRHCS